MKTLNYNHNIQNVEFTSYLKEEATPGKGTWTAYTLLETNLLV